MTVALLTELLWLCLKHSMCNYLLSCQLLHIPEYFDKLYYESFEVNRIFCGKRMACSLLKFNDIPLSFQI